MREQDIILCIVGSKGLDGNEQVDRIINKMLDKYRPNLVISGEEPTGVDAAAKRLTRSRGFNYQGYPPRTKRWHDGFKSRNLAMAHACTHLIRIVSTHSTTYGSGWTRDRARDLGKFTEEFRVQP
jgi:hypothetical protein